ncbi:DNA-binding domain-containing protein [Asticcacaulis benevestitus]|uniref:Putative DNA-binding domain-containing protein n=1 Tax=Asticcacaulis benevestitus DSM 16100 = ATCC BAA-896 TaxID=1121022 RepID=V4PD61_9CAUL|nr:DNA-binding domain-containing protein [Asticcacaulis benevestitus]ESQ91877.1 hypothetical protein ABENE_09595 [Asticcacaulis benevestitus DSM 16100 = ATCC BAA-896]
MFEHRAEAFYDAFSSALAGDDAALSAWWPDAAQGVAGLSIYRNTVCKGLSDAIAASFPAVLAVVGPDWLREAAVLFAHSHPPAQASLIHYGDAFPDWLAEFEPARQLPYLPDLARLDRLWTEAHLAADRVCLAPEALGAMSPDGFHYVSLQPVPSVRLVMFDTSIPDLWVALRGPKAPDELELLDEAQALLIWRPLSDVQTKCLKPAAFAFLEACRRGESVAAAVAMAATHMPLAEMPEMFADLFSSGVFAAVIPLPIEGACHDPANP